MDTTMIEVPHIEEVHTMAKEPKELSALEKIKRLDEERAQIVEGATSEAMHQVEEAIQQLNALGFHYELVDTKRTKTTTKAKGTGTRQAKGGPCPICEYLTDVPHDGRKHRNQGDDKRPFTKEELASMGLTRVD